MFARNLFVHQKCFNYALTNLLFGLCKFVQIIDPLVSHLNPHPKALALRSTFKVLRAKEHTPTPYPFNVFTLDLQLNLLRSLGVCHYRLLNLFFLKVEFLFQNLCFFENFMLIN